ncbi:Periodic tryptophan protein 2-like protein [Penaeus vannamei]|uniref:Periodic tryptophan protein 2-like protein n=1 Tax=Penaeus vannamei TaxID=6689 RepID=A0A3R7P6N3_PENVA|nr:Periodic tryptophan protein 2-like protein [Penaeus vannamei]
MHSQLGGKRDSTYDEKKEKFHESLNWLEKFLSRGPFAAATDRITVADLVLVPSVTSVIEAGFVPDKHTRIYEWVKRCQEGMVGYEEANGQGAQLLGKRLRGMISRGEVHVINLNFRRVLYKKHFNRTVRSIKFSPDGKHFAVAKEDTVYVYLAPGVDRRIFNPFVLERVYHGAYDLATCLDWSHDSKLLAYGSRDMTTRVCSFVKMKNLTECRIGGAREGVSGVYFDDKTYNLYVVCKDGGITVWDCSADESGLIPECENPYKARERGGKAGKEDQSKDRVFYTRRYKLNVNNHLKGMSTSVTATAFHKRNKMMVTACETGDFLLFDMNDQGALIHSLNISSQKITSVALNPSGDWIALGVSSIGQLLVWEWQSETYVLKQQGHYNSMRVVTYSPDGQNLATGGEDGKVKLWSTQSSFSYVTFSEHTAPITGLEFTQSGRAVISSSLDGTVRAFDLIRYRNFKTLTSPRPTQFTCVTVDSSGELIAAGGQDKHDIYLWSLKLGKLLEVLGGHTGPVVSVQFSKQPGSTMMVSTAWDGTVKVWDAINDTAVKENIMMSADGLCVAFRPDGKQVAVATLDGQITMLNPTTGRQEGNILGQSDLGAGRSAKDKVTAKKNLESKAFTTLCYSSDGKYLIAGGQSKHVCIYSIEDEILIKKFQVTKNKSFDAMSDILNRKRITKDGTNLAEVEHRGHRQADDLKLPGARRGDMSKRNFMPEIRVTSLTFSPTGRSWAASLMMALRLNINSLKQEVLESIPLNCVTLVVNDLVQLYVESLLQFVAESLETTPHVGLYSRWATELVTRHGQVLKTRAPQIMSTLNALQKSLSNHHTNLSKVCTHNEYMLSYLLAQASLRRKRNLAITPGEEGESKVPYLTSDGEMEDDDDDDDNLEDMFPGEEAEP